MNDLPSIVMKKASSMKDTFNLFLSSIDYNLTNCTEFNYVVVL